MIISRQDNTQNTYSVMSSLLKKTQEVEKGTKRFSSKYTTTGTLKCLVDDKQAEIEPQPLTYP